jgi:hypothetical protein
MGGYRFHSWGHFPKARQQTAKMLWRHEQLPLDKYSDQAFLPFGNGRSYGDVCLNDGGVLIDTRPLNRFISFDPKKGVLRCEAGVLLSDILRLVVPKGWFLSVTPGTQFVTVGGAIANDVHGKNHHKAGTFGCHLQCFEILRSDGERISCSAKRNTNWFNATIGGLGLTGVITWAEIRLKKISSAYIQQDIIRYQSLDGFFELSAESDENYEYTVAWVDCLASGTGLGRGLFMRGNSSDEPPISTPESNRHSIPVPFTPPFSLINRWILKGFNSLHYHKQSRDLTSSNIHYKPFFYPLDSFRDWNRIYGIKGFLQFQCVIPMIAGQVAAQEILERTRMAKSDSLLAVMKVFGDRASPGLLSFPRPGVTLTLDFPNQGKKTFNLLKQLDGVVKAAHGAVYPAKDACMSADSFQSYFPKWEELEKLRDARFSSSFWRRVVGEKI